MIQKEIVVGIPSVEVKKHVCSSFLLGKQAQKMFPKATSYRAEKALELLHGDLCGPITPSTSSGNKYIFVLIDDYTRYMLTILLREKVKISRNLEALEITLNMRHEKIYELSEQIEEESLCLTSLTNTAKRQA